MIKAARVRALSHITGGGFYENIPRSIPAGLCARIRKSSLRTPPVFDIIAREGKIPERDMYNTFNMGVGMCAVVAKEDTGRALAALAVNGAADAYVCGEIIRGEGGVELCLKTAVLVSGGGTTFRRLSTPRPAAKCKHVELSLVVSNRADAFALERGEKGRHPRRIRGKSRL